MTQNERSLQIWEITLFSSIFYKNYTTEAVLWMPGKRMDFSIHNSRTNGHRDIYGNLELNPLFPILQNQSRLYEKLKTIKSFSEEAYM